MLRLPGSSATVVHRTVSFSKKRIITKGDANESPDPWVTDPDAVMGKVCYACSGKGLRRIYGGRLGVWAAAGVSLRRSLARLLVPMVRPLIEGHRLPESHHTIVDFGLQPEGGQV